MYEDVKQLMPSGAKGKNVYQGSLATQQSPSRDAGRRGESSGLSQLDAAGSVSMTGIRSGMPPTDDEYMAMLRLLFLHQHHPHQNGAFLH